VKSKAKNIGVKDKIGLSDLFKLKRMKPYIKPTKPHKHLGYHEIILITKGEGFHNIEFDSYNVNPPIIFCLEPGQVHHWEFTEKPEGYVLMFKPEFLEAFGFQSSRMKEIDTSITLDGDFARLIEGHLSLIARELSEKKENYKSSIAFYLSIILIELERLSSKKSKERTDINSKVNRFKLLLQQQFRTEKKVSNYAEMLHVSSKHLNELCKMNTGETASSIIQHYVCTEAKRLLIHTDKNITEVAFELGFDDSSHFSKFFKSAVGTSPTHFRRDRFQ